MDVYDLPRAFHSLKHQRAAADPALIHKMEGDQRNVCGQLLDAHIFGFQFHIKVAMGVASSS